MKKGLKGRRSVIYSIIFTREKTSTKPAIAEVAAWEVNQSGTTNHIADIESKLDKMLKKLDSMSASVNNSQTHKPNFNSSREPQHKNCQDRQNCQPPPKESKGAQKRLYQVFGMLRIDPKTMLVILTVTRIPDRISRPATVMC